MTAKERSEYKLFCAHKANWKKKIGIGFFLMLLSVWTVKKRLSRVIAYVKLHFIVCLVCSALPCSEFPCFIIYDCHFKIPTNVSNFFFILKNFVNINSNSANSYFSNCAQNFTEVFFFLIWSLLRVLFSRNAQICACPVLISTSLVQALFYIKFLVFLIKSSAVSICFCSSAPLPLQFSVALLLPHSSH